MSSSTAPRWGCSPFIRTHHVCVEIGCEEFTREASQGTGQAFRGPLLRAVGHKQPRIVSKDRSADAFTIGVFWHGFALIGRRRQRPRVRIETFLAPVAHVAAIVVY